MTFVEMQVKWSLTLTDRLGPEILTVLERKGQVLHRVRLHVKVPKKLRKVLYTCSSGLLAGHSRL